MEIKLMSTDELENLVISAAEEFYLNKKNGLNLTDKEYDDALDLLKERIPEYDIFAHLKGTTGVTVDHHLWMPAANKTKVNDISWLILGVKLNTFISQLANRNNNQFIVHYQAGNLKRVTIPNVIKADDQIAITDLPRNIFPPRLDTSKTFRIIGTFEITQAVISNVTMYGIIPEVEAETADWLDIRTKIVSKPEYFANYNWIPLDQEIPESIQHTMQVRKFDQWWNSYVTDIDTKFTPKMDGCSLVVYYKNDKLWYIASRSSDITGKLKTEYLKPFFPSELPGYGTFALMCESVIDLGYGLDWNSRQQANGLINSKYKICDVSKLLNFVVYDALTLDDAQTRFDLNKLRLDIHSNNSIEKFRKYLKEREFKLPQLKDEISRNEWLVKHLGGTHWLPKTVDSLDKLTFITDDAKFRFDEETQIVDNFKERPLAEINLVQPEDLSKIEAFEHGVIGGLRYARIQYAERSVYVFDSRDLSRPRVTTVDYFTLLEYYEYISEECQAHYHSSDGGTYLIDGLVSHELREDIKRSKIKDIDNSVKYPFHKIYKWTFNEVADTEIEAIEWQESGYGTLIPVIRFKTVKVEGSWLSRASSGGLSRLISMQCGPGSKIKVVRVNSTIPMVLQVLTKATFELPKCAHCGRQLTWDNDVYNTQGGAKILKCSDDYCEGKLKSKEWFLKPEYQYDENNLIEIIGGLIPIESYKPRKDATTEVKEIIKKSLIEGNFEVFHEILCKEIFVNMNRDKLNSFEYNVKSAFRALRIKLNIEIK